MCWLKPRHLLLIVLLVALLPAPAARCQTGASAVLLIVDGLGADYVYPGHAPRAVDGSVLASAAPWEMGLRLENVTVPVPSTGPGHAVLFTGCSDADPEQVGYPNCTIFDLARAHGYVCVAVLERGDTVAALAANDVSVHDVANSVVSPDLQVVARPGAPAKLVEILDAGRREMPSELAGLNGAARYAAYNRWALGMAERAVSALAENGTIFLLTVNVGGLDAAGHYLGHPGYLQVLDALQEDLTPLRESCTRLGVALVVTSDHGMAFPDTGGRGGHASPPYSEMVESRRIPLFILAPGLGDGVVHGEFGQQDVAPTLLGLMGIQLRLPLADGCSVLTGCPPPAEDAGTPPPAEEAPSVWLVGGAALFALNAAGLGYIYRLYRR